MDQRKTVLLADAGEEFRTLLWEEMEKTGEFSVENGKDRRVFCGDRAGWK